MDQLDDKELQQLDYLVAQHQETLSVEFKGALDLSTDEHRDVLAKALLAMANHGGGYVVVGLPADNSAHHQFTDAHALPSHDQVNDVVKSYADPVFHCTVHKISPNGKSCAVIVVPGGHMTPIRAKRNGPRHVKSERYYVRKPGPASEEARTPEEWNQLLQRCIRNRKDEMFDTFRAILEGSLPTKATPVSDVLTDWANDSSERLFNRVDMADNPYAAGYWTFSYRVLGKFERPSLAQFRKLLMAAEANVTGWPPWMFIPREPLTPKPVGETIEAWLYEGRDKFMNHADFWRASPSGLLYQLTEYQEDHAGGPKKAGTFLDVTLPIWRVGERLLHASRFAQSLAGLDAEVEILIQWRGLKGRVLELWASYNRNPSLGSSQRGESHTDSVDARALVKAASIPDHLPELVASLTKTLYQSFAFYEPSDKLVREELRRMVNREY